MISGGASLTKPVDRAARQKEFREKLAAETKSASPPTPSVPVADRSEPILETTPAEPQQPVAQKSQIQTPSVTQETGEKIPSSGNGSVGEKTKSETDSTSVVAEDDNPFKRDQQDNPDPEVPLLVLLKFRQCNNR